MSLASSLFGLVVIVDELAEECVVGAVATGGSTTGRSRGAILFVAQQAVPEVHGAQALHPTLQVAINRTAVGEGLVHQLLLIALLALVGQDVHTNRRII